MASRGRYDYLPKKRMKHRPWGIAGVDALPGSYANHPFGGTEEDLPGKVQLPINAGERLDIGLPAVGGMAIQQSVIPKVCSMMC